MSESSSEVVTLVPALLAFFVATPPEGKRGSAGNDAMLFTGTLLAPAPADPGPRLDFSTDTEEWRPWKGMALSRIGLWSFDLAQLKELQQGLDDHPNRNSM